MLVVSNTVPWTRSPISKVSSWSAVPSSAILAISMSLEKCFATSDGIVTDTCHRGKAHGGATTTVPDATHPPTIFQNFGGGAVGGGVQLGVGAGGGVVPAGGQGGGVPTGGQGGSGRGSGGRPAKGEGGGVRLRSPSWWNQSWFYNPF